MYLNSIHIRHLGRGFSFFATHSSLCTSFYLEIIILFTLGNSYSLPLPPSFSPRRSPAPSPIWYIKKVWRNFTLKVAYKSKSRSDQQCVIGGGQSAACCPQWALPNGFHMTWARNARRYEKFRRKTIKASLQHIVSWEKLNLTDTETHKNTYTELKIFEGRLALWVCI